MLPTTETAMDEATIRHLPFEHVNTKAGDVVVFSGWLLHKSEANRANRARSVYYVTYGLPGIAGSAPGALYSEYYRLLTAWIASGCAQPFTAADTGGEGEGGLLRPTLIAPGRLGVGTPP